LLGIVSALSPGSLFDRMTSGIATLGFALPEYVIGVWLILLFSVWLGILPGSSVLGPRESPLSRPLSLVLPIAVLALHLQAHLVQVTRASMLDTLSAPYVRTAVLKGLPRLRIVLRHVLPNALAPTIAQVGMLFGYTLGGLIIVETLFSYPGIGSLMVSSVAARDIPVVQATILLVSAAYCLGNLLADVAAAYINPRLRA
jgi:peptide/nickel transport system permease protein